MTSAFPVPRFPCHHPCNLDIVAGRSNVRWKPDRFPTFKRAALITREGLHHKRARFDILCRWESLCTKKAIYFLFTCVEAMIAGAYTDLSG